jgi:nitroimidazol reductase NimA-like FMN-containing flavoprotein (pyridoxamine 5'-phosphate oxidase superfamily)
MPQAQPPSVATTVRRLPDRAHYERSTVDAILDEGFVAHVGITVEGQPFVLPMVYGRDGDRLLLHGSVASRLLRALDQGLRCCATVTLLDGLVLAHAQRNHSVNYRPVTVLGVACRLADDEAVTALAAIVDHVAPGRATEARPADDRDRRETIVVELSIEEAAAKIRSGPPAVPSEEDATLPVWVGVVPLTLVAGPPVVDERTSRVADLPPSLSPWRRPSAGR